MQSNDTLDNPLRWRFPGDTFFVTSRSEMASLFKEECESEIDGLIANRSESDWKVDEEDVIFERTIDFINKKTQQPDSVVKKFISFKHNIDENIIEEAMDNTVVIADMVDFDITFDKTYLPTVSIPENKEFEQWYEAKVKQVESEGKEPDTKSAYYLRYKCIKGLKDKKLTSKEYRDRLEYELDVINGMGFPDYFLLLEDVVSWCHNNDIPVGPGRGCFVPGQTIETREGFKNIEEVKNGDFVLTHRGNYKEVKSVQKYKEEKEVAVIQFNRHNGDNKNNIVKSTSDHEYFIIPKHYGKDFKNAKWSSAQELEVGDILLLPIPKKEACNHSHKGHEDCINCFGKQNPEFIEEANRQYHETAINTNRVIEKAITTFGSQINDFYSKVNSQDEFIGNINSPDNVISNLNSIRENLTEMQEVFGFNEVIQFEKDIELFSEELMEMGYEIAIVEKVSYEHYNGDVYDLTVEVDTSYTVNGVAVHNSAAGSLVSYAIGITNVDPIEYGLLFERFLNPSRGKLPELNWASKVNLARGCAA